MQINDLQRQKYEWQAQVEEAEREAAELMAPTVRQYQSELVVLQEELDEATAKVTKNLKELEEVRRRQTPLVGGQGSHRHPYGQRWFVVSRRVVSKDTVGCTGMVVSTERCRKTPLVAPAWS